MANASLAALETAFGARREYNLSEPAQVSIPHRKVSGVYRTPGPDATCSVCARTMSWALIYDSACHTCITASWARGAK